MWYYELNGAKFGPVDAETIAALIRAGKINETTRVRRLNADEWKFLDETDLIWVLQDSLEDAEEEDLIEESPEESALVDEEEDKTEAEEACWFYTQDERVYGPVTFTELQTMRDEGMIDSETLISPDGTSDWKAIAETELAGLQRDINKEEVV